jgi:ADP-ribose pyrophosphatase YjhB (NUDIX family)
MIKQMTTDEKIKLQTKTFQECWCELWGGDGNIAPQYKIEETTSRNKFNDLKHNGTLDELIRICNRDYTIYEEPEYGFPKGRREFNEKDYDTALRETVEETGFEYNLFINIKNILPFTEVFLGSNYRNYKHSYYLMYMHYNNSFNTNNFERSEVSAMQWKTYEECIDCIRSYNIEKKRLLYNIENTIKQYNYFC